MQLHKELNQEDTIGVLPMHNVSLLLSGPQPCWPRLPMAYWACLPPHNPPMVAHSIQRHCGQIWPYGQQPWDPSQPLAVAVDPPMLSSSLHALLLGP